MSIYIQDPVLKSDSLHEALLQSCDGATLGGGAFAWASKGGVDLLLRDSTFLPLMQKGQFELIVGTDAVTTPVTLAALNDLQLHNKGLRVHAFLNEIQNCYFHPKFCWFRKKTGGCAVVGSGNLTTFGLRKNWEAFTVVNLSEQELKDFEKYWANWIHLQAQRLKPVTDAAVLEQAQTNVRKWQVTKKAVKIIEEKPTEVAKEIEINEEEAEDVKAWQFSDEDAVLISEIPKGSDRWNQTNYHKHLFPEFFGIDPNKRSQQRVILRSVLPSGQLSELEVRPCVSVKSRNFRLELKAASGLDYPKQGRPIVVFIRVSTRMFIYMLVMPDNSHHKCLNSTLQTQFKTKANQMLEGVITTKDLKNTCPRLPLWSPDLTF